jgi:hypothetical protein
MTSSYSWEFKTVNANHRRVIFSKTTFIKLQSSLRRLTRSWRLVFCYQQNSNLSSRQNVALQTDSYVTCTADVFPVLQRSELGTDQFYLGQAFSTFYMLRTTSTEFVLHAGNMPLNAQNEEWTSVRIILCAVKTENTDKNMKHLFKKCNSQSRLV